MYSSMTGACWPSRHKMVRMEARVRPLGLFAELYSEAVERVATALRSRFESGELRGWMEGDGDRFNHPRRTPPLFRIENECERRWVKTPLRALAVLTYSANVEDDAALWSLTSLDISLLGAAVTAMARDVLAFARSKGWSKRRRGEMSARLLTAAVLRRAGEARP